MSVPRKILVTGGSGAVQFVERAADSEHELQTVLLNHPQLIPAEDLGLDGDLLVVGRETTLASGSIDLLCLSKVGEVVLVEFKTGPQNPDFRHALAQVIDYGSDLWKLSGWKEFDEGVVHRYLSGNHVDPAFKSAKSLREAAVQAWSLDSQEWEALTLRLDMVLATGDFYFVVAAQRFTGQMKDSADFLNATTRYGSYFLIEIIRLDSHDKKAYAAQVVQKPSARSAPDKTVSKATETDFLAAIADVSYRDAMSELFSTVTALGLQLAWYTKGASIRLKTPDRNEPISIGWAFLEGGQWSGAKHVTFGVDPGTLKNHPTVATAISAFCKKLKAVPGGKPTAGVLNAVIFEPDVFPGVKGEVFDLLGQLKTSTDASPASGITST
jgi:hypothetical protein